MNRDIIRNYYTLEEIFPSFDFAVLQGEINQDTKSKVVLDTKFSEVVDTISDLYSDWYIGYVDKLCRYDELPSEPTDVEVNKIKEKFVKKLASIYNFTKDKYLELLNLYEAHRNNLINRLPSTVANTTTHRVNDTPQNSGDFTGEDFTSIFENTNTNTESKNSPETIISLLKELDDKYLSVIGRWTEEFKSLFI